MEFAKHAPNRVRGTLGAVGLALTLAACGGGDAGTTDASPEAEGGVEQASTTPGSLAEAISIPNDGTTQWEGHTPRGFAGSGVGLFAGDNLNPNFPNGEGIQILLTFALPEGVGTPSSATLSSSALQQRGDVFEALGELRAAPVSYEQFGPELFNIAPTGDLVNCDRPTETDLTCDVTAAAQAAIESGDPRIQLQLTLEELSDSDGEQDLALFFLTDSNTNEPGIFTLELS